MLLQAYIREQVKQRTDITALEILHNRSAALE